MEPCAPGTEEDGPIMYSTLTKQEKERERILGQKAYLRDGSYGRIFEPENHETCNSDFYYCRVCECPVLGKVFQHEIGKRHTFNLAACNYDNKIDKGEEESSRRDEDDEPATQMTVDVAPGEPLPPGFENEVQEGRSCQIQERLDGFKAGPLVALEYLLELQDYDPSKEPVYLCILCDKRGDPRTVLTHLASYHHISQYLQRHFPTSWRALTPYMTKQYKRNWQAALQKIGEGIERKFGRLKPMPIDKDKFEKDRGVYLNKISKGKHFSEQSGYTFEELIVHDELTKAHDGDNPGGPTVPIAADWVAIQKPFKKRSPSPPVVNAPKKGKTSSAASSSSAAAVATNPNPRGVFKYAPRTQGAGSGDGGKGGAGAPSGGAKGNDSSAGGKAEGPGSKERSLRRRASLSSVSSGSEDGLGAGGGGGGRGGSFGGKRGGRGGAGGWRGGRGGRFQADKFGRNRSPVFRRRRSPSPPLRRRSPSPRHRSPPLRRRSPRFGRSPSPRRPRRDDPFKRQVEEEEKEKEREKEKLRKMEEYKKLSRAIENDMANTLKQHEKNPEKHPNYNEEWKKFWNRRYKELQANGVDASKYDFKPEWIEFWNRRMVELHSDEVRAKKEALRKRLDLDEMGPIKFKIGSVSKMPNTPMAALPDTDNEVIVIEDSKDDGDRKRANSPWEQENVRPALHRRSPKRSPLRSPPRRSPPRISPSRRGSPRRSSSRRSSPRRSPFEKSRSMERGSKRKSRTRSTSRDRSRPRNTSPFSRSKDMRSGSRDREWFGRGPPRDDRGFRENRSRERSWERKRDYRESSFERDVRGRERIRTVDDLPWGLRFDPPPMMRDVRPNPMLIRPPMMHPDAMMPPPEDDDDDVEINVVDVLRILTALEDKLGSLGPKVIDLLAQALALEKKEANSSETLLDNDINCVIFETVKEKLKGQLIAGLVDLMQERAFKKAIKKTAGLLHLAGERKKKRLKTTPKTKPVAVPGVGAVDKAAIAKQIANALIAQGKTDVTQQELEQLINAVVGMAEASKNSNKPMTTAAFVAQISGGGSSKSSDDKPITPKKEPVSDLDKLTEPLTPSPGRNSLSNMENLSDSDLQTLLQNFKDLSTDEQHNLINYLKKMELQEPERVEKLRQYVNLEPPKKDDEDSKSKSSDKRSPFLNRFAGANPGSEDLIDIESDDDTGEEKKKEDKKPQENTDSSKKPVSLDSDEEDYTFEDVVKSVSKTVKAKETETNKKIVEETMKFASDKLKADANLADAKDLISNLMSNISKSGASDKVDLLGLGQYQPATNSNVPNLLSGTDLTATLGNINMSNLASIMNSVKNFPAQQQEPRNSNQNDQTLGFEPPPNRESPDGRMGGFGEPANPMVPSMQRPMGPRGPIRPLMGDIRPNPGGFGHNNPSGFGPNNQRGFRPNNPGGFAPRPLLPRPQFSGGQQQGGMQFSRGPRPMEPRMNRPRFGGYGNRW
ncbi:unnamed protein product [Callosobruchus maculatus]|uniref:Uncharacterized protein n=2 Tax=Callosobruchus maculatus TaxID=64391 RepID=A0A653BHG0_CALMS|nr:unnamed protein product [Callosobruchus maculatus]